MPRKQRFKPSRKPKPVETPASEPMSNDQIPSKEPERPSIDSGDIEGGGPMRSREDPTAAVEGERPHAT